eukprot:6455063-Amphidinium_carterae.2
MLTKWPSHAEVLNAYRRRGPRGAWRLGPPRLRRYAHTFSRRAGSVLVNFLRTWMFVGPDAIAMTMGRAVMELDRTALRREKLLTLVVVDVSCCYKQPAMIVRAH